MTWFLVSQIFSMILTLFRLGRITDTDKDLEILILRQQLSILHRKQHKLIRPSRAEKMSLAVLAARLKKQTNKPRRVYLSDYGHFLDCNMSLTNTQITICVPWSAIE